MGGSPWKQACTTVLAAVATCVAGHQALISSTQSSQSVCIKALILRMRKEGLNPCPREIISFMKVLGNHVEVIWACGLVPGLRSRKKHSFQILQEDAIYRFRRGRTHTGIDRTFHHNWLPTVSWHKACQAER